MRIAKKTQQGRYYFHKDHLGSSTAMTDATGAKVETTEYVPYGEMRDHQGTEVTNYKFTDQELDPETGLYNYGARLYDPVIGRFITPDIIIPDVYDPQMLNRYSYCRNNPLIYVDPNGHMYGDAEADGGWEGADYGGDPSNSNDSSYGADSADSYNRNYDDGRLSGNYAGNYDNWGTEQGPESEDDHWGRTHQDLGPHPEYDYPNHVVEPPNTETHNKVQAMCEKLEGNLSVTEGTRHEDPGSEHNAPKDSTEKGKAVDISNKRGKAAEVDPCAVVDAAKEAGFNRSCQSEAHGHFHCDNATDKTTDCTSWDPQGKHGGPYKDPCKDKR